ncbi:MAG: serine protease [Patescibacteria group bacterium]
MGKNTFFKILAFFIAGMIGGIFAEEVFWPYFIERPLFYQYRLDQRPVYVTEKKEIRIQENTALKDALEKVKKTLVGVRTKITGGRILEGSGLILTSDGLMVTLATLIPLGSSPNFFLDDKQVNSQILKRDLKENLVLIKLEGSDLVTAGFGDLEKLKIGERVFILGAVFKSGKEIKPGKITNEGIVRSFDDNLIQTNIFEKTNLAGSPLFDIEGKVLGINIIDKEGRIGAISIKKIRDFAGI